MNKCYRCGLPVDLGRGIDDGDGYRFTDMTGTQRCLHTRIETCVTLQARKVAELENRIKALEATTHNDLYDRVEILERKLFAHV